MVTVYETFAGIGSQFQALKNIEKKLNFQTKNLGVVEWYIDAIISYQIIHYGSLKPETILTREKMVNYLSQFTFSANSKTPVSNSYFQKMQEAKLRRIYPYLFAFLNGGNESQISATDITKLITIPENIDILTYSFPCQDLSQQGKQKGLETGTRSSLLYEIERILKSNKSHLPKFLIMENVKALTHQKFRVEFNNWIKKLEKLGYQSEWKVLNAADFGSCQNRNRVFMVSGFDLSKFQWPKQRKSKQLSKIIKLDDISLINDQENINKIFDYKWTAFSRTKSGIYKAEILEYSKFRSENYLYLTNGIGPTLTASGANSRLKFYFPEHKIIKYIDEIESYQYMGFSKKVAEVVAETNLIPKTKMIFTCGNSISIEVLEALFEEVIKCL
ncbi:DNA (cytosine-5-)-methyltransferase N-terminal subunit [Candidatus Mycoplasma pogonae]